MARFRLAAKSNWFLIWKHRYLFACTFGTALEGLSLDTDHANQL